MTHRTQAANEVMTQKLMRELKAVVQHAEEVLKAGSGDVNGAGHEAQAKLTSALNAAKTTYLDLQERAIEGAKKTDALIHENPYPSMAIAFGVGLLAGVLVMRR